MTSFVKRYARKRCCWNCNIWPNWFTSHQSHYCLYYNGIPEFVRKRSMLNVVQYLKFHCQKVESTRNGKLRRLSGRFQTLIWRPGEMVQNLESPGLSGRVDSRVASGCHEITTFFVHDKNLFNVWHYKTLLQQSSSTTFTFFLKFLLEKPLFPNISENTYTWLATSKTTCPLQVCKS